MALPADYVSGTITLENGSANFTGTGTGWLAADFREGDVILDIAGGDNRIAVVQEITGNGAGTLSKPWEGPDLTAVAYRIRYQWDSSRVSAQSRAAIDMLGNGNLQSLAAVTGPGVVVMDGPHSVIVKPESDFINGVAYDVQVDTLADRAAYDGQTAGFAVLVSDVGDGRSAIYSKNTNSVGDWSGPGYVTGPVGPEFEITVGDVTTLAPDQPATVTPNYYPGGVELDFAIPRGPTGDITGVTTFWNTRLGSDADAAAARAGLSVPADTTGLFRLKDTGDPTKILAFILSGLTTGVTRSITVPDKSGTMALTSDLGVVPVEDKDVSGLTFADFTSPLIAGSKSLRIIGQNLQPSVSGGVPIMRLMDGSTPAQIASPIYRHESLGWDYSAVGPYGSLSDTVVNLSQNIAGGPGSPAFKYSFIMDVLMDDGNNKHVYWTMGGLWEDGRFVSFSGHSYIATASNITGVRFFHSNTAPYSPDGSIQMYRNQ